MNETPSHCEVSQLDLWFLILGFVRYAMGRMTFAPSEAQDFIKKYSSHLTAAQLLQLADEIDHALRKYERAGSTLGATVDHETWKETAVLTRKLFEQRP